MLSLLLKPSKPYHPVLPNTNVLGSKSAPRYPLSYP